MNTKRSLFTSCISLLLCFVMLVSTTFAWFTDVAVSSDNKIQAGTLKLDLLVLGEDDGKWTSIKDSKAPIFNYDKWEPGYTDVTIFKVSNLGSLALKWVARFASDVELSKLAEVIDVYVCPGVEEKYPTDRKLDSTWKNVGTLDQFVNTLSDTTYGFLDKGESATLGIALKMQETAGNEYQELKLGEFDIRILATQASSEEDSFGKDYDADATWPDDTGFETTASLDNVATVYGELANDFIIRYSDTVYALLPAGVKLADGVDSLKFSGKSVDNANITLGDGDSAKSYDIHIEGIAEDNTVPITVYLGPILDKNIGDTSLKLYHEQTLMTRVDSVADFRINNQYTYDPETGDLVIYVDNFSVFSGVQTNADQWDGTSDTTWYNDTDKEFTLTSAKQFAGFRDLVDGGNTFAGKTVKLGVDIDLNNILFNPIGGGWAYLDSKTTFNGTFDGQNHVIYNIRVNGWELDSTGDQHSGTSKGAGLFSSVHNATIKNIAINGAEMVVETTSIGIIAGCAEGVCTFENIVVTNANLGNYQMRNGGIVGDIYITDADSETPRIDGYTHVFKNITVDSSVKLSSMWGDFDTGNGGVVGGRYGDTQILMENVIVACELDVFSDVTAAYQWYAYRRCGMLIGYTGQNSPKQATNAAADFLTCVNVNVYYGDWVNYTYYEYENQDNEKGRRYPWVRAEAGEYNSAFSNPRYGVPTHGGVAVTGLENATDYTPITFNQLYGGGQGVYGTAAHKYGGVSASYNGVTTKTIFIVNNKNLENLKLYYWYSNGNDIWTTLDENGVSLERYKVPNYNIYRLDFPSYVDHFQIIADDYEGRTFEFGDVDDKKVYTLDGDVHSHEYTDGKCICGAYKLQNWELVTDANSLKEGDKIVIVAKDYDYALSTTQNNNNRGQAAVTKTGDKVTFGDDVQIITLEAGITSGTFAFNTDSGYLYAASSSSNHLKTQATNDANGSWTITIENGVATIVAQGNNTRNQLRYNSTNNPPIFSCYGSGQKDVVIYKFVDGDDVVDSHDCLDHQEGANCTENATCSKCGKEIKNTKLEHDYVANPYKCSRENCGQLNLPEAGSTITIQQALWVAATLQNGKETSAKYVISGVIDDEDHPSNTGTTTITFNGKSIYITNIHNVDGTIRHDSFTTRLKNGDEITVSAKVAKNDSGEAQLHETWLTEHANKDGDSACDICGATIETEVPDNDYSGRYYIAAIRTTGNYFYMTSDLGTASTKRYQAIDSGLTVLPETISSPKAGYVFVLINNGDGTYSIQAEGVDGNNYLGWTSDNSGILVSKDEALKVTVDNANGVYIIHFTASDAERYLALNDTSGNNYFAWYKSGQKQNLVLIPAIACEHTNTTTTTVPATCTEAGSITVTCDDCGKIVSTEEVEPLGHTPENGVCDRCGETIGGSSEPTLVLEITKDDFNSTSYAANNNIKTENGYSYTSYQVMNQSSVMQWQKSKGYITIESNAFVKLELKVTAGTYTVTVGGKTVAGTTTNGVTTYDLTGLTGEIKISVGDATGKVDYLKFYK